jgi:hypothetical protein
MKRASPRVAHNSGKGRMNPWLGSLTAISMTLGMNLIVVVILRATLSQSVRFDILIGLPLLGTLIDYTGELRE